MLGRAAGFGGSATITIGRVVGGEKSLQWNGGEEEEDLWITWSLDHIWKF